MFHADGTYIEIGTDGQIDIGLWKPTGERTAAVTFFFADVEPDPDVVVRGVGENGRRGRRDRERDQLPRTPLRPEPLTGRCPLADSFWRLAPGWRSCPWCRSGRQWQEHPRRSGHEHTHEGRECSRLSVHCLLG